MDQIDSPEEHLQDPFEHPIETPQETAPILPPRRVPRYYEKYGVGTDGLMRCVDCQKLMTTERLTTIGSCECGCRRVKEITMLSTEEIARIQSGELTFPHSDEFLQEFTRAIE